MLLLKSTGIYNEFEHHLILLLGLRLILEYVPCFLCYFVLKKQFLNYHAYVKKHKILCGVAAVLTVGAEATTAFMTISKDFLEHWRWVANPLILFGAIAIVIISVT